MDIPSLNRMPIIEYGNFLMLENRLETPVTFIIFNRPDTTQQVFEVIRKAKPPQLFVIADGPRDNHPQDIEKCAMTRKIIEQVDWKCEVLTNFADKNLGLKKRVSSGLDWVFEIVEHTIILEDDCLPHPTFFRFCQELLERFKNDHRIMLISGNNFQPVQDQTEHSYYYSRYPHIWGWATWRRAWKEFDVNMELWPSFRDGAWLEYILDNRQDIKYWENAFEKTFAGEVDSWGYALLFACWVHSFLVVQPTFNMVYNIGFGKEATHTTRKKNKYSNFKVFPADFPLNHPPFMIRNVHADRYTQKNLYRYKFLSRIYLSLFKKI